MEQQPMKYEGPGAGTKHVPPPPPTPPVTFGRGKRAPPTPRDSADPQSQPYGNAFAAAYADAYAKIAAVQDAQAARMMGLSIGLRRASAAAYVEPAQAPVALDVRVTGSPAVGGTMTGHYLYYDANGDPEGASVYAWLRDGAPIVGETGLSHVIIAADQGHTLSFRVTPVSSVAPTNGTPVATPPGMIA